MESFEIILERYEGEPLSQERKEELATQKNDTYRELLKTMSSADVTQEVRDTLAELRRRGVKISLGSSSKNAKFILERVELLLIVSIDIFSDGIRYDESTMAYIRRLAILHRALSAKAEQTIEVFCGIPLYRPGESAPPKRQEPSAAT